MLRVAGLVDLLGGEERLLALSSAASTSPANWLVTRSSPTKKADRPQSMSSRSCGSIVSQSLRSWVRPISCEDQVGRSHSR